MSPSRFHLIARSWFVRCSLIALIAFGLCVCHSWTYADEGKNGGSRTWRLVSELSAEELVHIDFSTDTPRDANIPYLPAEAYPFESPYTAEEMGFRVHGISAYAALELCPD